MKWLFPPHPDIPVELLAWAEDPLLAQLLVQRGITTVLAARAFIDPDDYEPASPYDLPDMDTAVACLRQAIETQTPICVWGDFDVDGQTATTLLVSVLDHLGATVSFYIPDRLSEGHGINLDRLATILAEGVGLILTCDTGIEAHNAVAAIHAVGAQVIITDHHDLSETLPQAEAVINPKRLPDTHPLYTLPGVGVAYKLAEALTRAYRRDQLAEGLLDLVALGIVADVAALQGDTRYLLQRGLAVLRHSTRLGLVTLMKMTNLTQARLTTEHIGFWLTPRLNALGRLGNANQAVELLTTEDMGQARILAAQLDALNERRKMLVERTVVQALSQLADTPSLADYQAIVLAATEWHPGVIGIAASRLVERFGRPVILLTEQDGRLRGSARSIVGCDIHQAIKQQAHLLTSFGGHPMAAGLALPQHHLTEFRQGISKTLAGCMSQVDRKLIIEATVDLAAVNEALLQTVQKLAPFGPGNPSAILAVADLKIKAVNPIGRARTHRRVEVVDSTGQTAQVMWWNGAVEPLPQTPFDLAFTVSEDTYRGQSSLQLTWVAAREGMTDALSQSNLGETCQIIDLRAEANPLASIDSQAAIFLSTEMLPGVKRLWLDEPLRQADQLVLWQTPPGQDMLRDLIAATQSQIIYLVARPTSFDAFPQFVTRLMGLIKYGIRHYGGRLEIAQLAAALGHRPATVRLALRWLISQGKLRFITPSQQMALTDRDTVIVVRLANDPPSQADDHLKPALLELLRETAAYRHFVQQANISALELGPNNISLD